MDNLLKFGKSAYETYERSQEQVNQGGSSQNQNQSQGHVDTTQHHGQQDSGTLPVDHNQAIQLADSQSGSSGNKDLFSQAMSFLGNSNHASTPVNEEHITSAHQQAYNGDASNLSANALGSAAALQTLKSFMSGGGQQQQQSSGGDFQTKMIGMAMSEAATLFDKSGKTGDGDKQEAVNGAAATMFKLMVQSKLSGSGEGGNELASLMGGQNSGGLSQLMGMASKFTK